MKIETKTVTVERDVYISDDGKEFFSYDDCREHEMEQKEKSINFYNQHFKKCDFEVCTYAKLNTPEDVSRLLEVCNYQGIHIEGISKDEPGIYMYIDRENIWINISAAISAINKEN